MMMMMRKLTLVVMMTTMMMMRTVTSVMHILARKRFQMKNIVSNWYLLKTGWMYLTNHLLSTVLWSNAHLIVNFLLVHMYHSTTTVPLYHHCTRMSWVLGRVFAPSNYYCYNFLTIIIIIRFILSHFFVKLINSIVFLFVAWVAWVQWKSSWPSQYI